MTTRTPIPREDVKIRLLPRCFATTTRKTSTLRPIEGIDDLSIPLITVRLDATYEDVKEIAKREFFPSNDLDEVKLLYKFQNNLVPLPDTIGDNAFCIGLFLKSQPRLKQAKMFAALDTPATPATTTRPAKTHSSVMENVRLNDEAIIVLDKLEEGSTCIIYDALYMFGKVALKYVEKERSPLEAKREIKMLSQLRHPSVINFYGYVENDLHYIIVLEQHRTNLFDLFVNGKNDDIPITMRHCNSIIGQVAGGISYLHKNDVIHFDIKTVNILLDWPAYVAKIADFGCAILKSEIQKIEKEEADKLGTSCYFSPEMWERKLGKTCDVYAFGCVLYEMASEEVMWKGHQKPSYKSKTMKGIFPKAYENLSDRVKYIISKCWTANLAERPTAETLVNVLEFEATFVEEATSSQPKRKKSKIVLEDENYADDN